MSATAAIDTATTNEGTHDVGASSADHGASATEQSLEGFRRSQRLAYDVAEAVAAELVPGMTEKQAAARLRAAAAERGVHEWFHLPFAWFGDRTAFDGRWHPLKFFPTDRPLVEGMPVILDLAPVVDGYASDIGYSCSLGQNPVLDRMMDDLAAHRVLILDGLRAGRTLAAVYRDVDALLARQGYQNRHRRYPSRVIAHKVGRVPTHRDNLVIGGFGLPAMRFLRTEAGAAKRNGAGHGPPLWNDAASSEVHPSPGLWAVEPHLGFRGVGAKWEELLVVHADGDIAWLDDDLPHHRRWRERGVAA